jgi:hypothetical protein
LVATVLRAGIRAFFVSAAVLTMIGPSFAAGALAVGKCGAYGYAFDHARADSAERAAKAKCVGGCKTVPMMRACGAVSVDMTKPCGAYGYAVQPRISSALNAAAKQCYDNGGKECVIRAWACDAKG